MTNFLLTGAGSQGGDPIQAAIQANVLAYWPLTVGVADSGPSGYDLTNNNGATFSADGADLVKSSSQWLSRASNADLQIGNNTRLFDFWIHPHTLNCVIFCKENDANRSYELYLDGSGVLTWYCNQGGYTSVPWGSSLSAGGSEYYIQCWHDADSNEIGISVNNGTPVTTAFSASGVSTTTTDFLIGKFNGGVPYFVDGHILEFGVYDALMTAGETAWRYNGGVPRSLY